MASIRSHYDGVKVALRLLLTLAIFGGLARLAGLSRAGSCGTRAV